MAIEARELRPGGETVITRLADILVIQAIRSWIASDPAAQTGWLGALQDSQIAPVSEMASRLGYESEAAFSRAFKRFLGFSPGAVQRAKSDHSLASAGTSGSL